MVVDLEVLHCFMDFGSSACYVLSITLESEVFTNKGY